MNNVFVSYNFDDRQLAGTINNMSVSCGGRIRKNFVFVKNDVSHLGSDAIDREIRLTMEGCSEALFVVGQNNHNSPWINREVALAVSKGLRLYVMRLPNSTGGVPNELRGKSYKECGWGEKSLNELMNNVCYG